MPYTLHVLHLEDEWSLAQIVRTTIALVEPGCVLEQCADADRALTYASEHMHELDLLLLDVRVPGAIDGIGVAQRMRELGYARAIVLMSAFQPPNRALLEQLRCTWLAKPIELARLETALRQARRDVGERSP